VNLVECKLCNIQCLCSCPLCLIASKKQHVTSKCKMHWLEADPICREPRSTWQELGPSMSIQHSETNFRCFQCFPPSFLFGYFPSHWFFAKKLWKAHLVDGVLKASTPIGRIGNSIDLQPVPQAKGRYSTGANGYMACTTCLKYKDFDVQFTSNTVKWNSKEECADMSQHGSH